MYGTAPYLSTAFLIQVDLFDTGIASELIFGDSSLIFSWSLHSVVLFCIFEPLVTSFKLTFTFSDSSFPLSILTISSLSALVHGATSFNETVVFSLAHSLGWHAGDLLYPLQGCIYWCESGASSTLALVSLIKSVLMCQMLINT